MTSPATSLTSRQANRKRRELVDALKTSLVNLRNVRMFAPNDPDVQNLKAIIQDKIAEIEGEIVGTLTFGAEKRPRVQHGGEFGMSVLRKYWNLGIGGRMLAYLIEWARQTQVIRKINLRVRVDNLSAIHLYEKYGFVREGRRTREFYLHGQFIDVFLMGLPLDPD